MSFEDFWLCYPKKVAKQDALKAWGKLTLFDHAQIDCVLEVHCKGWRHTHPDYIPHAATWLNKRRFEDEVEQPRTRLKVGDPGYYDRIGES